MLLREQAEDVQSRLEVDRTRLHNLGHLTLQ